MPQADVTQQLQALQNGEPGATERLWESVYDELHRIARRQLRRRRPSETLNTTALVHEAYLKLVDHDRARYEDRLHFFAVSAKAMRHILIDYARRQSRQKRGGGLQRVTLDEAFVSVESRAQTFIALDRALDQLSARSERLVKVVELRFFGGMTEQEIAALLELSPRTVRRDWRKARAWLARALDSDDLNGWRTG